VIPSRRARRTIFVWHCRRAIAYGLLIAPLGSCAARAPARPTGSTAPDSAAIEAFNQATRQCAGLKTMTSELRLSGRVGPEKIRGTLHTGLAAPASVRFEAVAPFGQPFFILAGRDNRATLLLPRDQRVLADAAVADLLERLTGLSLNANDLRLILTACLAESPAPRDGRSWPGGWRAVTLAEPDEPKPGPPSSTPQAPSERTTTVYMKTINGVPTIIAADRGPWHIDYANYQNGWPRMVRIRSANDVRIDITASLEQVEINTDIDESAFVVNVPPGTAPMTLDHLRSVAPLKTSH
jgi:outer membrane biogenesis lipoprotein LolB